MQPSFKRGQPVRQTDMNAMAEAAIRAASGVGATAIGSLNIGGANLPTPDVPRGWWIRITGPVGFPLGEGSGEGIGSGPEDIACTANYPWSFITRRQCSTTLLTAERSGTADQYPALEVNGNQNVPAGSVVFAWVNEDPALPSLLFNYCCGGGEGSGGQNFVDVVTCVQFIEEGGGSGIGSTGTGSGLGSGIIPP